MTSIRTHQRRQSQTQFQGRSVRRRKARPKNSLQLAIESLERRLVLSTFSVVNLNDSGTGSLRAAIASANASPGPDTINFSVAGTINLSAPLMLNDTTGGTLIDATTAPGYAGAPVVAIKGSTSFDGFDVLSANNAIQGLQITSFKFGIYILGDSSGGYGIPSGTATNTLIAGNYIGTDGTTAAGGLDGILIDGSANNRIGAVNGSGARNVISGNTYEGVLVTQDNSTGNIIAGNYIGTNAAGAAAVPNGDDGIELLSPNNLVGTDGNGVADGAERNVVSGNKGSGIFVDNTGNVIAGNYIGTDANGATAIGNGVFNNVGTAGVYVDVAGNRIGTDGNGVADDFERNVISGNNFNGVEVNISPTSSGGTVIAGNFIGTDATGTRALGNLASGVSVGAGRNTRIGTDGNGIGDAAKRNVVSGNALTGISISNTSTVGTIVAGNYVGTDVSGTAALPNGQGGISVGAGASNTRIGTNADGVSDDLERNIVSGNHGAGISMNGGSGNFIAGNFVGTDVTGSVAIGNSFIGIIAFGVRIGTTGTGTFDAANRNVISGNVGSGIFISGSGTAVRGNDIGTNASGTAVLGNGGAGVAVSSGTGNAILGNSIFGNGGLGIDLGPTGVTPNDVGDGDSGANNLQNFPLFSSVAIAGGNATINGSLNSTANATFRLEFFANSSGDPSGYGEGETFLGSTSVTTDASGNTSFSVTFALPAGQSIITATATDSAGNTSEFAQWNGTTTTLASAANPSGTGQPVSFTATVAGLESAAGTPTGTIQFKVDGNNYGSPVALSGGAATTIVSFATAGNHTVVAAYTGNGSFSGSTSSATLAQTLYGTPTVAAPSSQVATEGVSYLYSLGSFSDPDGGPWSVDVDWGDFTAHTMFSTSTTGSLGLASHAYAVDLPDGPHTVTVTVTDSTNLAGSATFQAMVFEPAIIASATAQGSIDEGTSRGTVTVATFTHGTVAESDISASINWGIAGHTADSGTVISDGSGNYHVTGVSPAYAEDGR